MDMEKEELKSRLIPNDSASEILLEEAPRSGQELTSSFPPVKDEKAPPSTFYGLCVLGCIMCLTFGSYWVFDTPGAIPKKMKEYSADGGKELSSADILMFYSIYSWPNTVLALFGGLIVDRFLGLRIGAITFCFFICSGQILFAYGIAYRSFWIAFAGRFLFGVGGESLTVVQNSYTVKWFEGKNLALAFGIVVSFARVGSSVNFLITPTLASVGVPFALLVGVLACCFSFTMCFILAGLDLYASMFKGPVTKSAKERAEKAALEGPKKELSAMEEVKQIIVQIKDITLPAWILNFICMFFYVGVLTFNTVASQIMQNTGKKFEEKQATFFLSIPMFVSVFMSPCFGLMVDRVGRALVWIIVASTMMILSMFLFLGNAMEWFFLHPIPLMIWQGTGYALGAASIWPTLSHVVSEHSRGTAYGMMTSVQNVGMAIFPLVIGKLQDANGISGKKLEYTLPILIFIACEAISFTLAVVLLGVDRRMTGGRMNASHAQRKALDEKEKVAKERTQVEAAQAKARSTVDRLRKAAEDQSQLLVRDVYTSRMVYYSRLGLQMPPVPRPSIAYRSSFM